MTRDAEEKDVENETLEQRCARNGFLLRNPASVSLADLRDELRGLRKAQWSELGLGPKGEELLEQIRDELDRRTETAVAANGHLMVYRLNRINGEPIQHSATCHAKCGACAMGYALPDW